MCSKELTSQERKTYRLQVYKNGIFSLTKDAPRTYTDLDLQMQSSITKTGITTTTNPTETCADVHTNLTTRYLKMKERQYHHSQKIITSMHMTAAEPCRITSMPRIIRRD